MAGPTAIQRRVGPSRVNGRPLTPMAEPITPPHLASTIQRKVGGSNPGAIVIFCIPGIVLRPGMIKHHMIHAEYVSCCIYALSEKPIRQNTDKNKVPSLDTASSAHKIPILPVKSVPVAYSCLPSRCSCPRSVTKCSHLLPRWLGELSYSRHTT